MSEEKAARPLLDFAGLRSELLADSRQLLPKWFQAGKWKGREFVIGNLQGEPGESLSINSQTGQWQDFAIGAKGGDLIDLWAAIKGLDLYDAAISLGAKPKLNGHTNGHARPASVREILTIAPPAGPYYPAHFRHATHGLPSQFWVYRAPSTDPLHVIARYDPAHGKEIVPWTWNGTKWIARAFPAPRPLYGLDKLGALPKVLLVEGEKAADAAQDVFPEFSCMTWSGGAKAHGKADWEPLRGRTVTLWPDNDAPGLEAMAMIAAILLKLNCTVWRIDPYGWPESWDLADTVPTPAGYAEVHKYAAANIKPIEPPKLTVIQTTASPVVEAKPLGGSLFEIYARHNFTRKSNGKPHCNEANIVAAIGVRGWNIYYDDFANRICIDGAEWDDAMTLEFMHWCQRELQLFDLGMRTVRDGIATYAFSRRRNPVKGWLNAAEWDGVSRLKDLLPMGFGTQRDAYTEAVGRCFIIGMVARVLKPGCKVDCMPVFEGAQGLRKSTALGVIGGTHFSELHDSIMSKDFYISLAGKMLCEISELHAFKTADIERIKGIISNASDRYRAPYGSVATDHPRTSVFAGTTNRTDWNTDETGARRFWPVACGEIDIDWLSENRQALFAEAVERFKDGEPWWNVPEKEANEHRAARQDTDPWEALLDAHLRANSTVRVNYVLTEVLQLKVDRMDHSAQRRVTKILRKNGYEAVLRRSGTDILREWVRKGPGTLL